LEKGLLIITDLKCPGKIYQDGGRFVFCSPLKEKKKKKKINMEIYEGNFLIISGPPGEVEKVR